MFACKQVSNALAKGDYHKPSLASRIGMRIHVALCTVCGRYNRQVMIIQDGVRTFIEHEEAGDTGGPPLPDDKKAAIKEKVAAAAKSQG